MLQVHLPHDGAGALFFGGVLSSLYSVGRLYFIFFFAMEWSLFRTVVLMLILDTWKKGSK